MKKFFLVGAGVACLAFVGCSNQKDVSMSETSDCSSCTHEKTAQCTQSEHKAASPTVVSDKSHCEGQTGTCPYSDKKN